MLKKITQVGNSWGIIIPKLLFEILKINPVADKVEIELVGEEIRIRKAKKED